MKIPFMRSVEADVFSCLLLSLCYRRVYMASYEHSDGRKEFVALKKVRMDEEKEGVCFFFSCIVSPSLSFVRFGLICSFILTVVYSSP